MAETTTARASSGNWLVGWALRHRLFSQASLDAAAWAPALLFAVAVRLDFSLSGADVQGWALLVPLAAAIQVCTGLAFGLYIGRSSYGSFDEVSGQSRAVGVTTAALFVLNLLVPGRQLIPRSSVLVGGVTALVLMSAIRYVWRLSREQQSRPSGEGLERLLIFGAGEGGTQIVRALLRSRSSLYLPVALLDDDPAKRNRRVAGVPVVGSRAVVASAAAAHGAGTLLIAIPSAGPELVTDLTDRGREAGLAVKVLPSLSEMVRSGVRVSDIRNVAEADLLGRHQIEIDLESIAGYITGRRVLVTGAGGSIGLELCRQVSRLTPSKLIMVDRDESALNGAQVSIDGHALADSADLVLVDIRDRDGLKELFAERRPDVVFHTAALKHQPLLELHPAEAVKSNVWGTTAVLEAAAASGVGHFVNISTHKASDPSNVLGYSKRITERLTAHFAHETGNNYVSVRFGNVLGSRGSMLSTFQAQIAAGGPITVTHPEVTRYFMTVEEAVRLVIQAGVIGQGGQALVLDVGEPVRISDIARRMADLADRPIEVVFTGLRPGEKLHEVVLGQDEPDHRPVHPLVSHVEVSPLHPDEVAHLDTRAPSEVIIDELRRLCGGAAAAAASSAPPRTGGA